MKISIILLLILLAGSACASGQPVAPITHPIPIVIPGDGTVASGTAIPVCACPTGMVTPPQSQGGATNPSAVICNCPAILVPPPVPTSGIGSNPQTVPANGITLADNRKTFA